MKDKNSVVVGIGLAIIICIVALVAWANTEFADLSAKTNNAVESLIIQQKDVEIRKLAKQLKAKQSELDGIKADLSGANAKIENIKADLAGATSAKAK